MRSASGFIFIHMIQIQDTVVSLDILEQRFCCHLASCKGSCCIEGESGAPVEKEEETLLKEVLPLVWEDLSDAAKEIIERQGVVYTDWDGELVTSIVNGKDCVFTCYNEQGICFCAIEKAWRAGKTDFQKPISCHLYPIRIKKYPDFLAINYHEWSICSASKKPENNKGLYLYQFLREPLIRKFGQGWYDELALVAEHWNQK